MDITIQPGKLHGEIAVVPSKSQAHRLMIGAAFADGPTQLFCSDTNRDIEATADCLRALGADIQRTADGYQILPATQIPETAVLPCCESGSTLRFMLPIAGALGVDTTLELEGRLPQRPLSPLWEEMERMGCQLSRPTQATIRCQGKLHNGAYEIDGSVSSQFVTGLLYAMSLMDGDSSLTVSGKLESRPYVEMTQRAMACFGIQTDNFCVRGGQHYHTPGKLEVEGDWSNGAFFLTAVFLGSNITVTNLNMYSPQGDRAVTKLLPLLNEGCAQIDASDIPDLVPVLSIAAGAKHGAIFHNIRRLRLKESDRVASVIAMVENLGGKAEATEDTLRIFGTGFCGGTVDTVNDHRIAMAAAIAATVSTGPVTILGAQCAAKSYPAFWAEYRRLGGML